MDKIKRTCANADERGVQQIGRHGATVPPSDLYNQVVQLLCSRLSHHSFMVSSQ